MTVRGPLLGFNDNVAHGGATYHVQTEDLGPRRRQVTTHLFADGGRIVHTERASYEDLGEEAPAEVVRQRMKEQHRRVIAALRAGEHARLIDSSNVEEDERGGYRFVAARAVERREVERAVDAPEADLSAGAPAEPVPLTAIGSTLPSPGTPSPPASKPTAAAASPSPGTPSPPPRIELVPAHPSVEGLSPRTLRGGFGHAPSPSLDPGLGGAAFDASEPSLGHTLGATSAPDRRLDELVVEFLERRRDKH
jgi:hypothetical protein